MPALPGDSIAGGYDALAGGDTLEFGAGIDLAGPLAYFHSGDLVLNYGGDDWSCLNCGMAGAFEHFRFADGPTLSRAVR